MGREAEVLTRLDGHCQPTQVRLESDALHLRAPRHLTVRFREVKSCEEADGWLTLRFGYHRLDLHLGKAAARWREDILSPPCAAVRLGIKEGESVAALGFDEPPCADAATVLEKEYDVVLLNVGSVEDLEKLGMARMGVAEGGALWIVYPRRHERLSETLIRVTGCSGGWLDVRTSRLDDERVALKFVRRG